MTKLIFPAAVLNQHIAVLGKTGSGKSTAMRHIAEHMLDSGPSAPLKWASICIIDPKGDWWGLQSSQDGKGPGYPIVIFGGLHADVPITAMAGAAVGEIVATSGFPTLIDLSEFTVHDRTRFYVDFISTVFRKTIGKRIIFMDEVHNFAPQGKILDPLSAQMIHWSNRLASEGRGKGITLIVASQRPQKVHKDLLTSCETLIAMRVIHKLDRKAISDWLDGAPDQTAAKQVLADLANLPRGTGWVWSPEIGFGPKLIEVPMFETYDSFKPQQSNKQLTGRAEIDLTDVRKHLAEYVASIEANDPRALKKRIAELEKEKSSITIPADVTKEISEKAHREGYEKGFKTGYLAARDEASVLFSKTMDEMREASASAFKQVRFEIPGAEAALARVRRDPTLALDLKAAEKRGNPPLNRQERHALFGTIAKEINHQISAPRGNGAWGSLGSKIRMAVALKRSPNGIQRDVWGVLAGVKPGGTLTNYISEFTSSGQADRVGNVYQATSHLEAPKEAPRATLEDLVDMWSKHGDKPSEILRLVSVAPRTRQELSDLIGIQAGGTLTNYISYGTSSGLIERRGDRYEINPNVLAWLEQQP